MEILTKAELDYLREDAKSVEELFSKIEATEHSEVENMDLYEGDVVVMQFPTGAYDGVPEIVQKLQDMYPDNPVIAIVKDIDILVQNPDEALEMLDGMKAKIQIMKGTPADKKIIV